MKDLHDEGLGVNKIAAHLKRSTDWVSKYVFKKDSRAVKKPGGRPPAIGPELRKNIQETYADMFAKADAQFEVMARSGY